LALNAFGLHRKKEETLALILEENARKNPAKPWISNRQIYVGSGTVLTVFLPDQNLPLETAVSPMNQVLQTRPNEPEESLQYHTILRLALLCSQLLNSNPFKSIRPSSP
jgi:hypothetical protein